MQRCRSVQLLAMSGDREGFYPKLGRVTLGRESGEAAASIAEEEEEAEERLKELCTPLKPEPNVFIAIQVSITTGAHCSHRGVLRYFSTHLNSGSWVA